MLCSNRRLVWWLTCLGVALIIGNAAAPAAAGGGPEPGWSVVSFNGFPKITGNITVRAGKDETGRRGNGAG